MQALAEKEYYFTQKSQKTQKEWREKKWLIENFCEFDFVELKVLCFLCEMKESHAGSRRKRILFHTEPLARRSQITENTERKR